MANIHKKRPDKKTQKNTASSLLIEVYEEESPKLGLADKDWPTTPEGIQQLLGEIDREEPVEWTDEEWLRWQKERQEQKERELIGRPIRCGRQRNEIR